MHLQLHELLHGLLHRGLPHFLPQERQYEIHYMTYDFLLSHFFKAVLNLRISIEQTMEQ